MVTTPTQHPMHIMIAVDGSEHSMAGVALLHDLPLPPGSQITILAVLPVRHTASRANLMAALDKAQAALSSSGIEVMTGLLHGHPAEELTHYAEAHPPDLIILGAKGLRATLGILLGGIAQQLVEYARWPVLVVRLPYIGLSNLLLVTDGSPYSDRAIEYLGGAGRGPQLPLPPSVDIKVMHVLPPLPPPDLYVQSLHIGPEIVAQMPTPEMEELVAHQLLEEEKAGRSLLDKTVHTLKNMGVPASEVMVRGDAATEIIAYATAHRVDLIVAGSRGLSEMRGWLLGSVSRKLLHYAPCSILVVKT